MYFRPIVFFIFILMVQPAMAIEEPAFEVLRSNDDYEVRQYAPCIVAEVDVEGKMGDAGRTAFGILAGYIFGENEPAKKMAMTAPVTSQASRDGERMKMTAPVISDAPGSERESYTYAFVMESRYTMATLPKPIDPRIRLVEKPARVVAARRYSGSWSTRNYQKNESALMAALDKDGIALSGEPYLARYNSPFTLWFMRRNELLIEIEWPSP